VGSLKAAVPKDISLSHHHRMKKMNPNVSQFYKRLSLGMVCFTAVNTTTHIFSPVHMNTGCGLLRMEYKS
jgi:hypothetical protein